MIDRDQLREALEVFTTRWRYDNLDSIDDSRKLRTVLEAARLVADPDTLIISKEDGRKGWACYSTTYRGDKRPSVLAGFLYTDDGSVCKHDHPDKGCGPVIVLDALLEGQPK